MKTKKLVKKLTKMLDIIKADRDELYLKLELEECEKEDLRNCNMLVSAFTEVINYHSVPSEHI